MRKATSTLIGLTLVALGAGARAEDRAPAPPAPAGAVVEPLPVAAPPAEPARLRIALAFLPMGLGKFTTPISGMPVEGDASFAYGFGLSADWRIIAGFSAGFAPQVIYNVNYKVYPSELAAPAAVGETDYLVRLAYTYPIVEKVGVYVEALPGYSNVSQHGATAAKGFVFGFGAGADMEMANNIFATLGAGYQLGFQSITDEAGQKQDYRTKYVRVVLGGGARFF
jgi:hypothetical protein